MPPTQTDRFSGIAPELKTPQFLASLKQTLEQAYRDGVQQFLAVQFDGKAVTGQFRDGADIFDFTIDGNGIRYQPKAIKGDAYTEGFLVQVLSTTRRDRTSKAKRCGSTSYSCGATCISKSYECRINSQQMRQSALRLIDAAEKQSQSSSTSRLSPQAQKVLAAEEDRIRNLPREEALFIDPETGAIAGQFKGDETSVGFSAEDLKKAKGKVVTHNHPNLGWDEDDPQSKGLGFSPADIEFAAVNETAEIRAVTSAYNYSLKPPKQGWNALYWHTQMKPAYQRNEVRVYNMMVREINAGNATPEQANADYHHVVMEWTAQDLGLEYSREDIKPARKPRKR